MQILNGHNYYQISSFHNTAASIRKDFSRCSISLPPHSQFILNMGGGGGGGGLGGESDPLKRTSDTLKRTSNSLKRTSNPLKITSNPLKRTSNPLKITSNPSKEPTTSKLQMTKTTVKIQRILMRVGALQSAQLARAVTHAPKPLGRILHNIQTSNDKNYNQNPTNFDESWSVGIRKMCSSCHTCSQASRKTPTQHPNFK